MMKKFLITTLLSLTAASAIAQELSQYTASRVQRAHSLAQEEKLKEAISTLESLDLSRGYDQAFVARMLGIFYWQNEQVKPAIKQLDFAVSSGLLQDEQAWQTRKMLADILLNEQQFAKALPHYYELSKAVPKNQKAHEVWLRIAQSHYQLSQWNKVLSAMERYEKFGQPDELGPLSIKLSSELELKKWQPAIVTIKRLIAIEPERVEWWRQLVALYLRVDDSKRALDAMALAKLQGVALSQDDFKLLAQLYAKRGIPERAALIMEQLEDLNVDSQLKAQQATYWQMAKEWDKSIDSWRVAAKLDSKYYWNYSQLLVQQGHYQQALAALDKVKGRNADVALIKTRAYYKLNRLDDALANAKRANEIKPSNQAKSWVKYLTQRRKAEATQSS
ncbi:tetratricopeptide repeat protein [Vibrio parahaemolyticus]|uniref:tetratricopeptide repeat protein n=1 Tax=Vibrio parahaemolyticus TaxID=670 RepID=UPI00038E4410|nr:tetratricopeptide repeat protein [Vibrio parahaemolyticus]EJG0920183.1 tetratricopeptide repeat protein [Vibrio parahaemolyticus O1:K68]EJG0933073.1 tetratricopeptide repeat protein [Vibrio parahaemolyticus O1]EJG0944010.1 tetratricopeptide repeat protein [Vibrio parahaemolyticus O10]EQM50954.1 TPR repeat family protein [Vibrio parahaemolyticus VPCR-2010]EGQ7676430.1 tetratricopeptide repeat protein [Vibrio parahaemolyticus]